MKGNTWGRRASWWFAELVFVALLCAGALQASARTWVASADGTEGDGTVTEILPQMQDADSLRLLAGDHDWPYPHFAVAMSLLGDEGARVVGTRVIFQDVSFVEIVGIEFFRLDDGMSVRTNDSVILRDCVYRSCGLLTLAGAEVGVLDTRILDNVTDLDRPGGVQIANGNVRIERCVFAGNRSRAGVRYDETESGGGALDISLGATSIVRGCLFLENEAISGSAMHCRSNGLIFEQNTVVGNRCESGAVVVHPVAPGSESTVIRQNIFADNAAFGLWIGEGSIGTPRVYCNAFWQNNSILLGDFFEREDHQWRAMAAWGYEGENDYHSTLADPMFCDSLVVHKESELADQEFPCEPIGGARGIGCVVNPVRSTSWGALKHRLGR